MWVLLSRRGRPGRARVLQLVRYGAVSIVATTTSLVVLGVLVGGFDAPAAWSNVAATAIGTVPSYELNRRWVWGRRGHRSLAAEIVPFCVLSFGGLVLSTLAVHVAADMTAGWSRAAHTAAVELANVAAFGSLWVLQFVVLDRVLFRRGDAVPAAPAPGPPPPGHDRRGAPRRTGLGSRPRADRRPCARRARRPGWTSARRRRS